MRLLVMFDVYFGAMRLEDRSGSGDPSCGCSAIVSYDGLVRVACKIGARGLERLSAGWIHDKIMVRMYTLVDVGPVHRLGASV